MGNFWVRHMIFVTFFILLHFTKSEDDICQFLANFEHFWPFYGVFRPKFWAKIVIFEIFGKKHFVDLKKIRSYDFFQTLLSCSTFYLLTFEYVVYQSENARFPVIWPRKWKFLSKNAIFWHFLTLRPPGQQGENAKWVGFAFNYTQRTYKWFCKRIFDEFVANLRYRSSNMD